MGGNAPCPLCGCALQSGADMHRVLAALAMDDVDQAIEVGLLECGQCPQCADTCTSALLSVRQERTQALAARDRYRARNQRLQRRAEERAARRSPPATGKASTTASKTLPAAAAAALARAKARALAKP